MPILRQICDRFLDHFFFEVFYGNPLKQILRIHVSDGSEVFKKLHSCKDLFSITHRNSHHFVSHTAAKAHLHTANESSLDDAVNILVVASLLPDDTVKEIFTFKAHSFRLISVRFSLKVALVRV